MALRYATKTGNWSDTTVWDGGTLPATTDDVFANTYTVTIDQDITVLTLRSVANTTPAITAGGYFQITTVGAGVTRNVTITNGLGNVAGTYIGNNNGLLRVSATAGTVALGSTVITGGATGGYPALAVSGAGVTVTGTGSVTGGSASNTYGVSVTATATVTLGHVIGGSHATGYGVAVTAAATLTVASCIGSGTITGVWVNAFSVTPSITVSGAVTGGSAPGSYGLHIVQGTNPPVNLQGAVTASASAPAVYSAVVAPIRATGPLTHGPNGHQPINAPTWMCKPTATAQTYNVYDDSNGPATGVLRSLANVTSGNQGPAPADVRTGTAYGAGLIGTMAVPAASSVQSGVSVDATTGTAALSGDKVWTYNVDTGVQAKTRLLAASTLASDGAAIAAALTA